MIRILDSYNGYAVRYLSQDLSQHENIHQTRLCFKRLRSLLRLGQFALGKSVYRQFNIFYRDQARKLSGLRDQTVLLQQLITLIRTRRSKSVQEALISMRDELLHQRKEQIAGFHQSGVMSEVRSALIEAKLQFDSIELSEKQPDVFIGGIIAVYEQGRNDLKNLEKPGGLNDHMLHEWRKQVKYLWYQIVLISKLWPNMMDAWASETKELSKLLGSHHDMFVLQQAIDNYSKARGTTILNKVLISIEAKKRKLETLSFELGSKLFAEKPSALKARLESYLPRNQKVTINEKRLSAVRL